jgi:pimeloyl-ACP methyl ester carboxylesterase
MEKTSTVPAGSASSGLFSRLAKKKASLLNNLVPDWTNSKIDNMLFVHNAKGAKTPRLPRGISASDLKTGDGNIKVYEIGRGPAVVLVHGWGGGGHQFFPLMRGLAQCGFRAVAFDHLGHGHSERKPATLHQTIATTNQLLDKVRHSADGLYAVVGHSTGCIAIAAARNALVRDLPLFLISPVFNYKQFFLRKLVGLGQHAEVVKKYANGFARAYRSEFQKLELARNLDKYGDYTLIAHDESDSESAVADSIAFCSRYPLTKLLVTKNYDHAMIISSESVWHALKSHLNYDDTSIDAGNLEVSFQ